MNKCAHPDCSNAEGLKEYYLIMDNTKSEPMLLCPDHHDGYEPVITGESVEIAISNGNAKTVIDESDQQRMGDKEHVVRVEEIPQPHTLTETKQDNTFVFSPSMEDKKAILVISSSVDQPLFVINNPNTGEEIMAIFSNGTFRTHSGTLKNDVTEEVVHAFRSWLVSMNLLPDTK